MGEVIKYNIRDILNEIKWTKNIEKAEVAINQILDSNVVVRVETMRILRG